MANEVVSIHKTTALPVAGSRIAHALYLVGPPDRPEHFEFYATGADPTNIRRLLTRDDVQAMIAAASGGSNNRIVDTIALRDAITPKTDMMQVYVVTATGDPTVASGGAMYMWRASNSTWVKLYEAESLDIVQSWANLTGKPSSTPANIDDAVSKRHAHTNLTQLNKIGETAGGDLTYGGNLPKTAWAAVDW